MFPEEGQSFRRGAEWKLMAGREGEGDARVFDTGGQKRRQRIGSCLESYRGTHRREICGGLHEFSGRREGWRSNLPCRNFPRLKESAEQARAIVLGEKSAMPLTITSPSFPHNGMIPLRHTCDGLDISPALDWTDVPANTKSLALIIDDPDAPDPLAPKVRWVHWLLYNLPADSSGLPEGVTPKALSALALQGRNDWGRTGYGGPCPPIGVHRYMHRIFALDVQLPDLRYPTRAVLEKAMQGHVIERAELVGRYQREY